MKYSFEIYINTENITADNWRKFYQVFNSYGGLIGKLKLIFEVKDKVVRFYVQSEKDLSSISNNLESMIIREIPTDLINIPKATNRERFFNFVTGGNILDTKEKILVKTAKDLQFAVFDIRAINATTAYVKVGLYFKKPDGNYSYASKTLTYFPANLLEIKFDSDSTYLKKKIDKYLDIEKSLHLFSSDNHYSLFEVQGFPYLKGNYYINLSQYDFYKHSFIVGASGSGKSKLISLLVDRIASSSFKDQYNVVVVDPHNSLKDEFLHITDSNVIGFGNESVELFNDTPKDIQAEVELTSVLFKSLMADQYNARLERVLKYSLFALYTAQSMSLDQLKRFLTESELRNKIIEHVNGFVPDNVVRFFGADFNEIRSQYYTEAIMPIISLVDEMSLQPGMTSNGQASISGMVNERFLTIFSLNKVSMGEKVVKTIAGLIIQQLFLLAQARAFGNKKTILIIDEVSVVQNPALAQILAEARKFGLTVVLTQQYFGQIDKSLQDAIFANVYNYYVFKVSEEDARALEGNLTIELPKTIVEEENKSGLKESDIRVKMLTELSPRECLVRLSENDKLHPCVKARTVEADFIKKNAIEAKSLVTFEKIDLPKKFVESEQLDNFKKIDNDQSQSDKLNSAFNSSVASLSDDNNGRNSNNEEPNNNELHYLATDNQPFEELSSEAQRIKELYENFSLPEADTADKTALEKLSIDSEEPNLQSIMQNKPIKSNENYNEYIDNNTSNDDFINISMLLAEQSSSRKLVNEYKKGDK